MFKLVNVCFSVGNLVLGDGCSDGGSGGGGGEDDIGGSGECGEGVGGFGGARCGEVTVVA